MLALLSDLSHALGDAPTPVALFFAIALATLGTYLFCGLAEALTDLALLLLVSPSIIGTRPVRPYRRAIRRAAYRRGLIL